ncbi:MAG: S24/S26 family peptidase [Eubacterium sp.]|nr:S24/S26 family peptidase [Eubacterium sp.]
MLEDKNLSLTMQELMPLVADELASGKEVMLTVKGVSMMPFLRHNKDSIIMTALNGRSINIGDLVMFRRADGSYAMHRICRINADGSFDIVGDAQLKCDENITYDMLVAYVPRVIKNGKEISCEKGFWRFAMVSYMHLRLKHPKIAFKIYAVLRKIKHTIKSDMENDNE